MKLAESRRYSWSFAREYETGWSAESLDVLGEKTIFKNAWEPPENSRRQKGDMKHVPHLRAHKY
jgi:hypothetical protein